MVKLAQSSGQSNKIGGRELADHLMVAEAFLLKILRKMATNNLISSAKGPGGGYYLNQENRDRKFWEILNILDCTSQLSSCILGLTECSEENPCALHFMYAPFKNTVIQAMEEMSVQEFTAKFEMESGVFVKTQSD